MKSPSLLSHLSIRMQILIGFLPIIFVLGLWTISSHHNFTNFANNFSSLSNVEDETKAFIEIEKDIIELQRNVLVYSYVGYRGVLRKIETLQEELEQRFEKIRPIVEQDATIKSRFDRLYNHYEDYNTSFIEAVNKRKAIKGLEKQKLKPQIKQNHSKITSLIDSFEESKNYEAAYLTSKIEIALHQTEANIWALSTAPDAAGVRKTNALIDQAQEHIISLKQFNTIAEHEQHISSLSLMIDGYQNTFLEITNLNRVYIHLMNVVLAGKAAEIDVLSRELEALVSKRSEALSNGIKQNIHVSQQQYIFISIIASIIGVFSALFIATGIATPVNAMASTLGRLAKGQADIDIPGQNRKDEVGQMAKAANEFKTMALRINEQQQSIKKSEAKLSAIVDNTVDGMVTINKKGDIESFNKACEKIFDYKADEVIGKNIKVLMPEPYHSEHDGYLKNYKETGERKIIGTDREVSGRRKNGTTFPMNLSIAEINIDGTVLYSGILRDITNRKIAENLIEERSNFERLITNTIPDLVFVKDEEFKIIQANDAFLSLYPEDIRDSVIGSTTLEEYKPEEAEKFLKNDRIAFEDGYNEAEEIVTFPSGAIKTLLTKKVRFNNQEGKQFILGISRDISAIKKTSIDLQKQRDMLELAEETATLGHWHYNLTEQKIYWSEQVYNIHDTSSEKYTPTIETAINFYHPNDREDIEAAIQKTLDTKVPFEFEKRLITDKGHTVYVHSIGHPELDENDNIIGIFGVFQDITDRKKAEEELLRSNKELDDFAYIASHDLKEPLRGLHNHARFLLEDYEDKLDEDGKHKLGRLIYLSERMEKLTSDLFYYSRIGRGEATIEKVDLNEIVLDVKKLLADKENTTIEITETLPTIECEKVRIEELYRNLITNGIKYNESKNKKIEVGINKNKELYVKDNGIGIAPKFHTEVFKIFKRLHKREAYGGGTGSGLTFVKKIIDRHQGKIWIDSDIEKGTTFYFTLPGINR